MRAAEISRAESRTVIRNRGHIRRSPMALEDAQRTVGLVRFHAAEWHIDPHKIGVLGFSAGGHLVAAISTHFRSVCIRRSMRPTKKAAVRILLWLFIRGTCGKHDKRFSIESGYSGQQQTPPTFLCRRKMIRWMVSRTRSSTMRR